MVQDENFYLKLLTGDVGSVIKSVRAMKVDVLSSLSDEVLIKTMRVEGRGVMDG